MTKVCIDYDPLLYMAGSVGETRTVKIVHRISGDEYEFDNRTSFYGHWKKKAGGWLAEYNAAKSEDKRRSADEFDYFDIQAPEPIENCIHTLKMQIKAIKEATDAKSHFGFTGKGKTFREDVSTVVKYKGNRDKALRPLHLDALKDYLIAKQNCELITGIEADDACSMTIYNAWKKWTKTRNDSDKVVLAFTDKDYLQCAGFLYHPDTQQFFQGGERFGRLYKEDRFTKTPTYKGEGRLFLYFQILSGDDADNYFANSGNPEMKWGDAKAFSLLKDTKSDKEAWQVLVDSYKTLYPSKKTIKGWRGDDIEIDWLYMLQENTTLAHMLRWDGDKLEVKPLLDKLGVEYE